MKKLKPHTVDWAQIERFLASADKKLASGHKILAFDEEACLQQAYEAMLKASLGFMWQARMIFFGSCGFGFPGRRRSVARLSSRVPIPDRKCGDSGTVRRWWVTVGQQGEMTLLRSGGSMTRHPRD